MALDGPNGGAAAARPREWLLDCQYESHPNFNPSMLKKIKEYYINQEASFWTAEEIDLSADLDDWDALKDGERHFIKHVLAFFAASDGIVLENLASRFLIEMQLPAVREFYAFQVAMENIHSETYSLLIDTYLAQQADEKLRLLRAIEHVPAVKRKAEWAVKWINGSNSLAERLLAFCAVEGILFSGSFCAIFWLKKRGLLPGLSFSNELISRDEGMHTEFGALLYNCLQDRLPQEQAYAIVCEALDVERHFITEALPAGLIGMNADLMVQYLECVTDRLLASVGYEPFYGSQNPFSWMEMISLQGKTNFFEKRVGDYQTAGAKSENLDASFATDCEF